MKRRNFFVVLTVMLGLSVFSSALAQPEPYNEPRCKPEEVDLTEVREENGRLVGVLHLPESPYLLGEVRIDCPLPKAFPEGQAQTLHVAYKSMGKKALEAAIKAIGQSTKAGEQHQWSDANRFLVSYSLWPMNAEPSGFASHRLMDASFYDDPTCAETYAQAKDMTRTLLAQLGMTAYEPLLHSNRYDAEHCLTEDELAEYSHGDKLRTDAIEGFRRNAAKMQHTEPGLTMVSGMFELQGLPVMPEYSWEEGDDLMGASSVFSAIVSDGYRATINFMPLFPHPTSWG